MRKTTTFFVLVASILIQLTAARKEHVICQDVLQIPNVIEDDGRKGNDTDILREIRIFTNMTTDYCHAENKLHHPGQETVKDPDNISTSGKIHYSRQSKTQIRKEETIIVGNNRPVNDRRRTDKRMASAIRVRNTPLQKSKKLYVFVRKDIHPNQDGTIIRRDIQFSQSRRRLNDDYRRLSTERKQRLDSKMNIFLSDKRREEAARDSRRREHFTGENGRQNIGREQSRVTFSRKEDSTLARYTLRRKEDLRDEKSGLNLQSGSDEVRNVARMEARRMNSVTRDLTDGERMNQIIGETRDVAENSENLFRARSDIHFRREGEVMGRDARRVDRLNQTKRLSNKLIRKNGDNERFGNGKKPARTSDGRVTNIYREHASVQRHIRAKNIRAANGKDLSESIRSTRTREVRRMDRDVRERRAVKNNTRERRGQSDFLRYTRDSDEKRQRGSSAVRRIETEEISVRLNQGKERMVGMKLDDRRDFILQSRRDDKYTPVQEYGYSSNIRRGNYYEHRTDTIDTIGINIARSHERAEHIEDIARALTVTRGELSIRRDQRSRSERRDVISDRRLQSDVSRLTNRRFETRQTLGQSLRQNEDVFETERVKVARHVSKRADKRIYVTEQPDDVRRSLQHEENERREMFLSSGQESLGRNRERKRAVMVFKEKRQDHISITKKETSTSATAKLIEFENTRLMEVSLSSQRESEISLTKVRFERIMPVTERNGNNWERSRRNNMKSTYVRNGEHLPWTLQKQHSIWNDVMSVSRALLLGAAGLLGTRMLAKEKVF